MKLRPLGALLTTIPSAVASSIVVAYRVFLSPILVSVLGPACRFQPTCSAYAGDALSRYGLARGGLMALRRILRCRPGGGNGYDPVPTAENDGPSFESFQERSRGRA